MAQKTNAGKKPVKPAAKKPAPKASPIEKRPAPATKKPAPKASPVAKMPAPAVKKSTKQPTAKVRPKATTAKSKTGGLNLIQSVKTGVQTGMDAVSELVKKLTTGAPKPAAKKTKRK
jgi:hypothetical protein